MDSDDSLGQPFYEWSKKGYIGIAGERTLDYVILMDAMVELHEKFNIQVLAYDPFKMPDFQDIVDRDGDGKLPFSEDAREKGVRLTRHSQGVRRSSTVSRWDSSKRDTRGPPHSMPSEELQRHQS